MSKLKKIGEGLQYNVYDLGNGRVLKKEKTFRERVKFLKKSHAKDKTKFGNILEFGASRAAKGAEYITYYSIKGLKRRLSKINPSLLGSPVFFDDYSCKIGC